MRQKSHSRRSQHPRVDGLDMSEVELEGGLVCSHSSITDIGDLCKSEVWHTSLFSSYTCGTYRQ